MGRTHKHKSSEAQPGGGLARNSDEGAVMALERRSQPGTVKMHQQQWMSAAEQQNKPYAIKPREIMVAWQRVRAKGGVGGVDGESIESFETKLEPNLYKLWNRMSSGSYHPKAVRRVEIPKGDGKTRPLGIPTIGDRVAQQVVKARLEPIAEKLFYQDSYGYRPQRAAQQAVAQCRQRCFRYDWVLDVDIQKFFDTIDHELMMRVVKKHCPEPWMVLYIERWLKAPVKHPDGTVEERTRGTPQGGVISPVLANLYLHYAFDAWMRRTFPAVPFERYADDVIIHCTSEQQSECIKEALAARLEECKLKLHPDKTKVVYCKNSNRKGMCPTKKFTFLGYTFQPRKAENRATGKHFTGFLPAVSTAKARRFRTELKASGVFTRTQLDLSTLAAELNPRVRGWYNYFAHFYASALHRMNDWLDQALVGWLHRKFRRSWRASFALLKRLYKQDPTRFAHWHFRAPGRAV